MNPNQTRKEEEKRCHKGSKSERRLNGVNYAGDIEDKHGDLSHHRTVAPKTMRSSLRRSKPNDARLSRRR